MRILFLGEIIGKSGLYIIKKLLASIKEEYQIDFALTSGNAVTNGFGMGKNHALYLRKLGINVITGTDAIYFKKDLSNEIGQMSFILRPANFPPKASGRGFAYYNTDDKKIGVLNVMGQSGYSRSHASNPFTYTQEILANKMADNFTNIVTFHALATAEKQTLGHHLAGKAAAVIGYGGRSLTADDQVINGTAYISDCGRIGGRHSAGGLGAAEEIEKLISQRPVRSKESWEALEFNGVVVDLNEQGQAVAIKKLRIACEAPSDIPNDI